VPHDSNLLAKDPVSTGWDVIVIGTGMGGGTLGYELARRGKRVLFLERGRSNLGPHSGATEGKYAEQAFDFAQASEKEYADQMAKAGRISHWLDDGFPVQKGKHLFRAILGEGTGGSSALYGMVTERFFPLDFTPRQNFKEVADSTVPESWPITYDELRPYYQLAEMLYRVRGTADPLRPASESADVIPPPPMIPANREVFDFLASKGMHPYSVHVACEYKPDCLSCQGYLCANNCKNESGKICVLPATQTWGATLLDECTVTHLESTRTKVTRVHAVCRGEKRTFESTYVVVAGGALMTPVLLLNSKSPDWPTGLGNDHDQVGRNFMRHLIDMFLFRTTAKEGVAGQIKEICLNDFYMHEGEKFGTIQSMGHVPPFDVLTKDDPEATLKMKRWRKWLDPLWKKWMQDRLVPMGTIMEDLPFSQNRVLPGPGSRGESGPYVRIEYRVQPVDATRLKRFQDVAKKAFGKQKRSWIYPIFMPCSGENKALGHQTGTCRFGTDPKSSVLDRDNKAWGLDNLYVVDTSILPSSAGMNPSLTVAANAIRVAEHLATRLG
jgi:choline dehydrogenase-like flavoprotein